MKEIVFCLIFSFLASITLGKEVVIENMISHVMGPMSAHGDGLDPEESKYLSLVASLDEKQLAALEIMNAGKDIPIHLAISEIIEKNAIEDVVLIRANKEGLSYFSDANDIGESSKTFLVCKIDIETNGSELPRRFIVFPDLTIVESKVSSHVELPSLSPPPHNFLRNH